MLLSMTLHVGPMDIGILVKSVCYPPQREEEYTVYLECYMLQIWAYAALSNLGPNGEKKTF